MFMEFTTYFFDYKKPYTKFSEILKSSLAEALSNRSKENSKLIDSSASQSDKKKTESSYETSELNKKVNGNHVNGNGKQIRVSIKDTEE